MQLTSIIQAEQADAEMIQGSLEALALSMARTSRASKPTACHWLICLKIAQQIAHLIVSGKAAYLFCLHGIQVKSPLDTCEHTFWYQEKPDIYFLTVYILPVL